MLYIVLMLQTRLLPFFVVLFFWGSVSSASADTGKELSIRPFQGKASAPTHVFEVLLKEYLTHDRKISPTLQSNQSPYQLKGTLIQEGKGYKVDGQLFSPSGGGKEILRLTSHFEYPETLNTILLDWSEQISKAIGSKLSKKKLLPFLNRTSSTEAYQNYAEGQILLQKGEKKDMAIHSFEQAVQNDYNYVPAYLGLAEALAKRSTGGDLMRARMEFEKAKLLNPTLANFREPTIHAYLEGKK